MLELSGVSVRFGSFHALRRVSLRVREGEVVVLLGANGAGKSTLLRAVSGLERPTEGTIRFGGDDLAGRPAHRIVRRGVALSPEGKHLFPRLSVRRNLLLGAFTRRDDEAAVRESMEGVYDLFPVLRRKAEDPAGTLSGGQQQMLVVGRALMSRPRLLLLDEPSLGLAPRVVEEVFEAVREINRGGTTVLLAEQNARAALEIASRGYVLETGEVVLEGSSDALLDAPEVRRAYIGV